MLPILRENEIRILSIPPGSSDVGGPPPIDCDILVASLSDRNGFPEYETLSYVWGTEMASVPILVSGQSIVVSRSLHCAIRRLQLPDRKRLLWIDQICINQQDMEEKTKQVQLMSDIYTRCSRCIAWVGEVKESVSPAEVDCAIQLLQYMATASQAADPSSTPLPSAFPAGFEGAIKALGTITPEQNEWWNRIWTVQEAALPEHVIFQWGSFEITWTVLEQAREAWVFNFPQPLENMLGQHPAGTSVLTNLIAHFTWLNIARHRYDDLFQMIHRYRIRRATDPRDKIYGLLGLCSRGRLPVTEKCDYSITAVEVFATLTQELIIHEQGLRPLTNAPRQRPSESTPGISSWALDLYYAGVPFAPDVYYLMHGYDEYNAAGQLGHIDLGAIKTRLGQKTLNLTGVYADTVVHVQDGYKTNSPDKASMPSTEQLLQEWYAVAVGCGFQASPDSVDTVAAELYPRGAYTRAEAFAVFVLGDTIRNTEQIPKREVERDDIQDVWKILLGRANEVSMETRGTVYGMMVNQRMFVTKAGYFGCGHMDTEIGDEVWVFRGGNVPFTIRPRKEGEGYAFVGQCYLQGFMRGEVTSEDGLTEKTVSLY
ncbi:HET-domain-containing protein [Bimuria novae-zelandiae CBS 107.79]|uniref:HET-domain-containing protein n=1 Tax=Bimuria novae-zelandiae CBS 107.79 TaxID=1447943 RepID=A0A6A5UTN0_9PLEO|nr:HET-domain-containing protein [Bimuria novae-zelandiae CBS 107.79]